MESEKKHVSGIELGEMIGSLTISNYIKASPFESGERSVLDREMTEELYFSYFYAQSGKAEAYAKRIEEKILTAVDSNVFIISGHKGCGKSTFVKHFLNYTKIANIMINFDDNWEPDFGMKKNVIMSLNNRIYNDFYPRDGKKPCRIVAKYLEIFNDNIYNRDHLKKIDDDNFFVYFGDKLKYAYRLKNEGHLDSLRDYYDNDIRLHIQKGKIYKIMILVVLMDVAEKIEMGQYNKCLMVFENLDIIYNTMDISSIVTNIAKFRKTLYHLNNVCYDGIFLELFSNYSLILVMRENTKEQILYCMKNSDKFCDMFRKSSTIIDITGVYDLESIVDQKMKYINDYLLQNPQFLESSRFMQIYNVIVMIKRILSDDYLTQKLSELLNYDYRSIAELLGNLDLNSQDYVQACERILALKNENEDWTSVAFRSIFFRKVFNLYVQKQYFTNVQKFEYYLFKEGIAYNVNLECLLLLYINDHAGCDGFASLYYLFKDLKKIFKDGDAIVDSLWQMYDMRREYMWNNLVLFNNIEFVSYERLLKELRIFETGEKTSYFAGVKVTKAGESYLNYILPNFEYYVARFNKGKGKSLFAMTAEEICNGHEFDYILKKELEEVSNFCQKLCLSYKNVFFTISEDQEEKYIDTAIATLETKTDSSIVLIGEQCIYSNISYLDSLRFYSFAVLDQVLKEGGFCKDVDINNILSLVKRIDKKIYKDWPKEMFSTDMRKCILKKRDIQKREEQRIEVMFCENRRLNIVLPLQNIIVGLKACLNVRLLRAISSLMGIFGFYGKKQRVMCSTNAIQICKALDACIKYRIQKAGFLDFETKIDVDTGEKILASLKF